MRCLLALLLMAIVTPGLSSRVRRLIAPIEHSGGSYGILNNITFNDTDTRVRIDCKLHNTSICISDSFLDTLTIQKIRKAVFLDSNSNPIPGCNFSCSNDYRITLCSFGKCAASIEVFGGITTVRYKICVVPYYGPYQYIARDVSTTLWLACRFNSTLHADDYYIKPLIKKVNVQGENQTGTIKISIKRYNDSNCTQLDTSGDVVMPYPVFVGIKLDEGASTELILQVKECWAQPTNAPGETRRYNIIDQPGCAAPDPRLNGANRIYKNFQGITAKFSFRSFVWSRMPVPGQQIYVYCKVKVCERLIPDSTCTDQPNCPPARRRRSEQASNDKLEIVRLEPLTVRAQPCDKIKLGCSHGCATSDIGAEMCVCPEGLTLQHDLKTCIESDMQESIVIAPMRGYLPTFSTFDYMVPIIVSVVVLSGILLIWKRKGEDFSAQKNAVGI